MATNPIPFPAFEEPEIDIDEESKFLKDSGYYQSLVYSPGWKKVLAHMDEMVLEAENDMKRHTFNNPVESMRLQMRWQQRGIMRDTLVSHIESVVESRRQILERIKHEHNPDNA